MEQSYNLRSPAVKRLMREAQELHEPTKDYSAKPLDDNLFEWHFTFRGPNDSDFDGGFYHGRIILPPEYPMKPPSIMLLNPNGRFELNKKICLSISGYHPESWQPSWSIRTAILAIIAFMPTRGDGAIGALDYTPEERKTLAQKSRSYSCSACGKISELLSKDENNSSGSSKSDEKDRELAKQILFAKPKEASKSDSKTSTSKERVLSKDEEVTRGSNPSASEESQVTTTDHTLEEPRSTEGIRQRPQPPTVPGQPSQQSDALTQSSRQSIHSDKNDPASLVIIVVLVIAIAFLMFRRFDKAYSLTSSFL